MLRIKFMCLKFINQGIVVPSSEILGAIQFLVHITMKQK